MLKGQLEFIKTDTSVLSAAHAAVFYRQNIRGGCLYFALIETLKTLLF